MVTSALVVRDLVPLARVRKQEKARRKQLIVSIAAEAERARAHDGNRRLRELLDGNWRTLLEWTLVLSQTHQSGSADVFVPRVLRGRALINHQGPV